MAGALHTLGPFDVPHLAPRLVRVFVPPRGPRAAAPPVLYVFDGQNVFHDEPSFAGGWHLHTAAERLASQRRRSPIVVGIDHGGAARIAELSPFGTARGEGRADALLDWVVRSLVPRIQGQFQPATGPASTAVGGSSMGGLAALYAHFRNPEVFGGALCMSPSLWYGGGRIFQFVAAQSNPWTSRVYLDAGTREAGGSMLAQAARMADHLRGRGYGDDKLLFRTDPKGSHGERSWRRRAPGAVRFLFTAKRRG